LERPLFPALIVLCFLAACGVIQTVQNIGRLKYKIASAADYKILGIEIRNKKTLKDFSSVELLKLTAGIVKGSLPVTFTLFIEAKNPNDGGGYPRTDLTVESLPWKLFVDGKETAAGNIDKPVFVPGKGESTIIPLNIEFDIASTLKENNLDNVLNLLLRLGGANGKTSSLKVAARPVVGTPFGKLEYPDEITIVDKSFN
jgi:hypothetical protein